jgi:Uma2 family endonuclease
MGEVLDRGRAPARRQLDVAAYYKMAEAGILMQRDRVELIGGEIFDMAPIGSTHAGKTDRLNHLFARAAADGLALIRVHVRLRLDALNEPQPDVMLLKPRQDYYQERHPGAADVLLLIELELSESSLAYDRGTKLPLYARFGVPEVWIVDLRGAAIEVYREPTGNAYALKQRLTSGSLAPVLVPGVTIDAGALLA